jgi:tetratricopeptide (TPR) repeat protein
MEEHGMTSPSPSPVFISYGRADGEDVARRLHDDLVAQGLAVWLDVESIPEGADWDQAIDEGLSGARFVLVLLSPAAVLSVQVKSEWNEALSRNLPMIPLLARDCTVPRVLAVFNYVDLRTDYEAGLARTVERLHELEANYHQVLRDLIDAFAVAQREAPDPKRFQPKLEELRAALQRWENPTTDRTRIERGMLEQIAEFERRRERRRQRIHSKVIGQPPRDVTTLFKDRTEPRAIIGRALADPATRLVTIIGRGGMGKTALATKILRDIEDENWPHTDQSLSVDGIVYESTRTNGITLERTFLDCARMLGAERNDELSKVWATTSIPPSEKISRLLDALEANARYILLLDNFEDMLDETGNIQDEDVRAFIEMNLTAPRGLQVLITSRAPLNLPVTLAPLEHRVDLVDGLPTGDGVTLLRELDAHGTFGVRDLPDADLAHAVEVVHGVPRALEVLVGIMANDPFARLQDVLPTFFEHEDTVRRIVQENYRRLDRGARQVMESLAVYDRPVPLVALEYLLQPFAPDLDVAAITRRLARAAVISFDRKTQVLALHPIDRDYAYSQIPREGGSYVRSALERRAAGYYARLEMPLGTWRSLDDLEPTLWEFEHLIRGEDYDAATRLLAPLYDDMGRFGLAMRGLAMHQQIEGHLHDRELQMLQAFGKGAMQMLLGAYDEALANVDFAVKVARERGDKRIEGRAQAVRGSSLRMMGRPAEAIEPGLSAYALSREVGDVDGQCSALYLVSLAYAYIGKHARAIDSARELAMLAEAHADLRRTGAAYDTISASQAALHRYEDAKVSAEQSAKLLREANEHDALNYVLNTQGLIELGLGQIAAARRYLQEAVSTAHDDGYTRAEALVRFNIAHSYRVEGDFAAALRYANESLELFRKVQSLDTPAAEALMQVIEDAQRGDRAAEAAHLLDLGRTSATNVDLYSALSVAEEARDIGQSLGNAAVVEAATAFIDEFHARAVAE